MYTPPNVVISPRVNYISLQSEVQLLRPPLNLMLSKLTVPLRSAFFRLHIPHKLSVPSTSAFSRLSVV